MKMQNKSIEDMKLQLANTHRDRGRQRFLNRLLLVFQKEKGDPTQPSQEYSSGSAVFRFYQVPNTKNPLPKTSTVFLFPNFSRQPHVLTKLNHKTRVETPISVKTSQPRPNSTTEKKKGNRKIKQHSVHVPSPLKLEIQHLQ